MARCPFVESMNVGYPHTHSHIAVSAPIHKLHTEQGTRRYAADRSAPLVKNNKQISEVSTAHACTGQVCLMYLLHYSAKLSVTGFPAM